MTNARVLFAACLSACVVVGADTVHAEEVVNGDFSSNGALFTTAPGYRGSGSNPAEIDNWTFSSSGGGNAGINGDGVSGGDPFGPSDDTATPLYAFIQGSGGDKMLSQVITLDPNTLYDVSYLAARRSSNGSATGQVTIADDSTTYYDSGSTNWSGAAFQLIEDQFSTNASFDGDVVISLINTTPSGDNTVVYGEVSVIEVPEPSSLALLAIGAGLIARRRRA